MGSGACNPLEVEALLRHGCAVKARDGLHAKVYLSSTAAVVASANASANGLGQEGGEIQDDMENMLGNEAGVYIDDAPSLTTIHDWFERMWRDSASLDVVPGSPLLAEAEKEWKRRRGGRPVRKLRGEVGIVEAFWTDPHIFDSRPFYATHTSGYGDEGANEQRRKYIEETEQIDADDSKDGEFVEGGLTNWFMKKDEVTSLYPPGSWFVEVWTPEPRQWDDPDMRVSAFWEFRNDHRGIPLKGQDYKDMVNLMTPYIKQVPLSGNARLVLNDEDKEVLVRGFRRLTRSRLRVVPLGDVVRAGLRKR